MRRGFWILVLFLSISATALAERYETGTLVRVNSSQTAKSSTYDLYIQYQDHTYMVHLVKDLSYQLEWRVNGPIEFRLAKDAIYLRHADGKDLKFPIQGSILTTASKAPAMPDLPFPSVQRGAVQAPIGIGVQNEVPMPRPPHCDEIATIAPEFDLLANACEVALSSRTLPNYISHETTRRWINDRPHDIVTAEVTFVNGRVDRRSQFTIDGKPVQSLEGSGGLITGQLFGTQLKTIFKPETRPTFEFKAYKNIDSGTAAVYSFHFKSENNSSYRLEDIYPSLSGTIWIDRVSGQLMRVQTVATDLPRSPSLSSYQSAINYDDVAIPELGTFVVPTDAEAQLCSMNNTRCFRNVISFRDYRRFGATSRIIPIPGP